MRSLVVAGVLGVLMLVPVVAAADDRPVVREEQFDTYCTPTDPALDELSGLTFSDGVLYAIGDSGTDHRVAVLDEDCAVTRWIDVPVDPYDVEDLASYGGQLWLADVGDNLRRRDTVALTRIDPATGEMLGPDLALQAEQVMRNLLAILAAAGTGFAHVAKTSIFLAPGMDFATVNGVYNRYFAGNYPARETVWVTELPKKALVEISMIAVL